MFWIINVLLVGVLYFVYKWNSNRDLPPGPWSIPVLGYLPWLNPTEPYKTLTELTRKHGPIYSIQMGKHLAVVISEPTLLRTVLARKELEDRTDFKVINDIMQEHGLIFTRGALWKEQRKFVCNWLKVIGVSKIGDKKYDLQLSIINTVSSTLLKIRNSNKHPIDTKKLFLVYIGDFINRIVLGKTWPEDDQTWIYLRLLAEDGSKRFADVTPLSVLPFLKIIPKYRKNISEMIEGVKNTHLIYKTIMDNRGKEIDECNDLMAMFVKEISKKKNSDMFGAGVETTINSLRWFLLYMAINKEIQNELQILLDSVCTNGEIMNLDQVESVSLLKACIFETMRIRPVTPCGMPRAVNEKITISSYCIPKGTMIIPLQWAMYYDTKYWTNPHIYQPKRFLDDDGNIINHKAFMPFQAGKRACVGETLSYWLLYLFGGNIIRNFNISMEENLSETEMDTIITGEFGITLSPAEHNLIFQPRV